jgi:hypothetical protein
MTGGAYTIEALDEATWDAFAALVARNNGVFGGCRCQFGAPDVVPRIKSRAEAAGRGERRARRRARPDR